MTDDHDELSRHLCFGPLVAPGVILTTENNALLAGIEYGGHDHTTLEHRRRLEIADRVGDHIVPLDGGWGLSWEWQRHRDTGHPRQQGGPTVPRWLDAKRAGRLNACQFRSRYCIGLSYAPEMQNARAVARWFTKGAGTKREAVASCLPMFSRAVDDLADALGGSVGWARRLDSDGLVTLLRNCVVPEPHPGIAAPHIPGFPIARAVAATGFVPDINGNPRLTTGTGKVHHLRVLGVLNFPRAAHPGWLDALETLEFEFRVNLRFLTMSGHTAKRIFKSLWRKHDDAAFDPRSIIAARFGFSEHKRDAVGEMEAQEAVQARIEAETAGTRSGWLTLTVVTWGETAEEADERESAIRKLLEACRIDTVREGLNAQYAWIGSLPGHRRANRRKVPLSHVNMVDLVSLSTPYTGPTGNPHWGCDALIQLESAGGNPVRMNLHQGEDGAVLVFGQVRMGKSTLMATTATSVLCRVEDARVVWLGADESKSASMVATWAAGGEFLGFNGVDLALQPLAALEEPEDRQWAQGFVVQLLDVQGVIDKARRRTGTGAIVPISRAEALECTRVAVERLSRRPVHERTISVLSHLLEYEDLRLGLKPYCRGGAYGHLIDADRDSFSTAPWVTIDLMRMLESDNPTQASMVRPVVRALFRRIYRLVQDGRPTAIFVDEAWRALADYPDEIDAMRRRTPKMNVALVLATHLPDDILNSGAGPILQTIKQVWSLGDSSASEREVYAKFGINPVQRTLIDRLDVGEVLVTTPQGSRVARLRLEPALKAICAADAKLRDKAREIVRRTGPGERFTVEVLEAAGLYGEAEELMGEINGQWLQAAE